MKSEQLVYPAAPLRDFESKHNVDFLITNRRNFKGTCVIISLEAPLNQLTVG
ncbi:MULTISPECIES: hypothetical protein [Bacillus]|uniref:hypothetical protein n=1 Tax=Bacillus TaxID=1386 RepID=UPI002243D8A7|nr:MULTISPECIES: hypothetical protein [Bacillus]MDN5387779.1 hypothetical protein [Bacillus sp. LB7]MEC1021671.1 hypothetical protein [Bacillus paralicheniformis]MEC1028602.1 hypothetical protein [Bacillus paralicheniformis]MEC1033025.1 hypothetical protein [Bacillus paralicheniformis]MEC1051951.1 hypothetical protein [Bacillus paralicheniformis]